MTDQKKTRSSIVKKITLGVKCRKFFNFRSDAMNKEYRKTLKKKSGRCIQNKPMNTRTTQKQDTTDMDNELKIGLTEVSRQEPFASLLGIELKALESGYAQVEMVYTPLKMNNIYGRAHGGAIFALIDEAFQLACQTHGSIAVALNVSVTYIAGPSEETRLTATAKEVHKTRKTAGYSITVVDAENRLVATCNALAYRTGKPVPFGA
ncbi:MAG: PaaI family thioesterase [Desulfobacterales bacterium]